MPDKILPDLQACILCEEVRQELNGNFILIGVLSSLVVPALPVTAFKLFLFTRWCCGLGKFRYQNRILLPDQGTSIAQTQGDLELRSVDDHLTQVSVFGNVQFQQAGTHWIEIHLESELKLRFPLIVRVIPPATPNR